MDVELGWWTSPSQDRLVEQEGPGLGPQRAPDLGPVHAHVPGKAICFYSFISFMK